MKKLTLTPDQNGVFTVSAIFMFLVLIHTNIHSVINLITTKFHPFAQISIAALALGLAGILIGISKVRQAGFSGQFTEKQPKYFKSLEIEFSIKGMFVFFGFICQIIIFSLSFYGIVVLFIWYLRTG